LSSRPRQRRDTPLIYVSPTRGWEREFQPGDHPDRDGAGHAGCPAYRFAGAATTYRQLDEQSDRFAAGLREAGLRPGEVVALQLPNIPPFLTAYFGALKAGLVVLPLNPLLMAPEIAYSRERLAAYKHPREIRFVDELPKGASGKILKSALRDQ
jgi:acyl-CoA synthetase (AMP-forming)/AMP-acid ligase II